MKKSTFKLFAALVIIGMLAAACAPAATPAAAPTAPAADAAQPTTAAPAQPTAAPAQPTTAAAPASAQGFTRLSLAIQGDDRNELNLYKQLVVEFEQAHPTISVDIDWLPWDAYETKLQTGFAASTPPDVFWLWINDMEFYASRGKLLDLTPYVKKDNFNTDDFFPTTLDAYKYKDGLYAIPRESSAIVLYYNKDLFDEAKIPYPDDSLTFDKYLEIAQKLTKKDASGNITQFGSAAMSDYSQFWTVVWSHGGDVFDSTKTKCTMNTPETTQAVQWMADLSNKYHVAPTAGEAGSMSVEQMFLSGKVAMFLSGRWSTMTLWNAAKAPKWDVAPVPALKPELRTTRTSAGAHAVAADSKHPAEAWELVKFLSSKEAYEFLTKSGDIIPAYKPTANSDTFLQPGKDPANGKVFLDAMSYAKFEPIGPNYPKVTDVLNAALGSIWDGTKQASDVIPALCPQLEAAAAGN
jgi:multiple sugar transport system substrate-binding protein